MKERPAMTTMTHMHCDRLVRTLRRLLGWITGTGYRPERRYMRGRT
jgi:hypothetical protein